MKKFILFFIIVFSNLAQSQLSFDDLGGKPNGTKENKDIVAKLNIINSIVSYSGGVVGFANACKLSKDKSAKIEGAIFKKLDEMQISIPDRQYMKKSFNDSVVSAEKRGEVLSKNECMLFSTEFDKIVLSLDKY